MGSRFPYEGDEQVLRHDSGADIAELARRSPFDVLVFPFRFWGTSSALTAFIGQSEVAPNAIVRGHVSYPYDVPLAEGCVMPKTALPPAATHTAVRLVRDFNSMRTRTLVYLAPIPDCRGAAAVAAASYDGLNVAPPAVLPHADFAKDDFFVHPLPPAVALSSDLLLERIKKGRNP